MSYWINGRENNKFHLPSKQILQFLRKMMLLVSFRKKKRDYLPNYQHPENTKMIRGIT
jgi:hypothetical protein